MHNKHQRGTRFTALLIICSSFQVTWFTFYALLFTTNEIKSQSEVRVARTRTFFSKLLSRFWLNLVSQTILRASWILSSLH